jgi:hypothetical protein
MKIAPLYHVQALNMMLVLHVKWANMFSEHFNLFLFEVKYFSIEGQHIQWTFQIVFI